MYIYAYEAVARGAAPFFDAAWAADDPPAPSADAPHSPDQTRGDTP
jgi:hypothetical protein